MPSRSFTHALRDAVLVAVLALVVQAAAAPALESGFVKPPPSARPHTWWHWCNGNITREGITADLEAMARVGVGGAQIFDVNPGLPAGNVNYMSTEWRAMIKHAMSEADRLGLEMCIHNGAGWSSSGGPWITPALAMQMLTVSEVHVKGPARFSDKLPQPPMRVGYYRDIAVLAFPTPPAEVARMADLAPKITASVPNFDGAKLIDGNLDTAATLPLRSGPKPQFLQFEFAQPFTARALTLSGGPGGDHGELQVSDDGATFTKVADFWSPGPSILRPPMTVSFAPASGKFFRLAFRREGGRAAVSFGEVNLEAGYRLSNWGAKAGYVRADNPQPDTAEVPADGAYNRADVVDLTAKMDADGRLTWDAPAGDWTILRFGHTPTGAMNAPSPEPGRGLECDKLSREAVEAHFAGMLGKITADLGPLVGKSFKHVLIDSYEVDTQNWSPRFREEFQKRRGYDPLPYLPVMTGRIMGGIDASERFLWDVRRTIADLYADNYFGGYADLCHQHGLQLSAEPYGNGGFDNLTSGGRADIPMTEFWAGWGNDNSGPKLASSVAHTYGRAVVGCESFTGAPDQAGWRQHPYSLKALGDLIYCGGVNRFIFHCYAHQPWIGLTPGMTMGPFGTEFTRNATWWEQGAAWMQYIARCQHLLQSGLFVGDLCYFYGEGAPNDLPGRAGLNPSPPPGYDYDGCDAEVILTRMSVRDGKIVLPDGMSYRLLVLPAARTMTPALMRKISDLVRDGATVLGPKPLSSPSLQGYPDSDREVQAMADEVWGPCDGSTVTEHAFGRGTVIWGKPLAEVLAARRMSPDFELAGAGPRPPVSYIHRFVDGADVYFVAVQSKRPAVVEASFRMAGKVPELWHPDTGAIEPAPIYRVAAGRTIIPLRFDAAGSVFVVFRTASGAMDQMVSAERDGASIFAARPAPSLPLDIRKAEYGVFTVELQDCVDVTAQLRALVRDGKLSARASNELAGDPALNIVKQLRVEYSIDGKPFSLTVDENQEINLPQPGQTGALEIRSALYGLLPEEGHEAPKPATVDVTDILRRMVAGDTLSVAATNTLAGDPAPMVVKQLRVDYTLGGKAYTRVVGENDTLVLPEGTEDIAPTPQVPPARLDAGDPGHPVLTAWEPGAYEVATAAGKRLRVTVPALPAPLQIAGPWEVRFPPKWGAPDKASFDRLTSWTERAEPGIKYFSGTATYVKQIVLPAALLARGSVLALDLGTVHEMAQVSLNGRDLGVLWKPPFRIDVTGVAKAGANLLEVRVTNLWPNRLIGDEQLPDDREWNGDGSLKGWPEWLVQGKPRPATGRFTFATWRYYTKDSPLFESGLLGPVRVLVGRRVAMASK